jgi:hypothetical protein
MKRERGFECQSCVRFKSKTGHLPGLGTSLNNNSPRYSVFPGEMIISQTIEYAIYTSLCIFFPWNRVQLLFLSTHRMGAAPQEHVAAAYSLLRSSHELNRLHTSIMHSFQALPIPTYLGGMPILQQQQKVVIKCFFIN